MPEEKHQAFANGNYLKWYFIRICLNQVRSTTSQFHYKYIKNAEEKIDDEIDVIDEEGADEIESEKQQQHIERKLSALSWYEQGILKEYIEQGYNYKSVVKSTKIQYNSIRNSVRLAIEKIKNG